MRLKIPLSRNKILNIILLSIGFVIALLIITTIYRALMQNKIFYRNEYNSVKLSGLKFNEAESKIANENKDLLEKKLILTDDAGEKTEVTFGQTGLLLDQTKAIEEVKNSGRDGNIVNRYFQTFSLLIKKQNWPISVAGYDDKKFEDFFNILGTKYESPAEDAKVNITPGGEIDISKENIGYSISKEKFKSDLENSLASDNSSITLRIEQLLPKVTAEMLQPLAPQIENALNKKIMLSYDSTKITVTKGDLASWISVDQTNVSFSKDKIQKYLEPIAKKYDKSPIDQIEDKATSQIIQSGVSGRKLNLEKSAQTIIDQIAKGALVITLVVEKLDSSKRNTASGKYILVKVEPTMVSASRVFAIENDKIIKEIPASTGQVGTGYETPTGEFKIQNKDVLKWSSLWQMNMPHWMAFSGGYGFHSMPYRDIADLESANSIFAKTGGCITIQSEANAQFLYNWTNVGTSVYIYKSSTPSCKAIRQKAYIDWQNDKISNEEANAINASCPL